MPFFTFNQNNSGGSFDFEIERGITHYVIIEAPSAEAANIEAIHKGLYFDGCDRGEDCSCCGDRWGRVGQRGNETGSAEPMVFSKAAATYRGHRWMPEGREIAVHYADGRIEWFGVAP